MNERHKSQNASAAEWREGTPVLAAATIGYGTGSGMFFMTTSLFIEPMRHALGWSTLDLTIGPAAALVVALGQPLAGRCTQRWGGRPVAILGALLLAIALSAIAFIPEKQGFYLGLGVVIGLIGPLTTTVPYSRCIATYFSRNLGLALGIALSGSSLVSFVTIPLVSHMIAAHGWRAGYLSLAAVTGLIGLPLLYLMLRERKVAQPAKPAVGSISGPRALLRNGIFWSLLFALLLAALPLGGFVMHIVSILLDRGVGETLATSLGVTYAVSVSIGRIAGGAMLDRFHDGAVAFLLLACSALGALTIGQFSSGLPVAILFFAVLLVGLGQGAEADFIGYFGLRFFGHEIYPTVVGYYSVAVGIGFAGGGFIFAVLRDWTGNYSLACHLAAICFIIGGLGIVGTRIAVNRQGAVAKVARNTLPEEA